MLSNKFTRVWGPYQLHGGVRSVQPTRRQACVIRRRSVNQPSDSDPGASKSETDELPPELRDLAINEDGFLIDTKTGKVINEMGATRFDVAVRALRGELDPPSWVENSERSPGVILSALYQFPRSYLFQVVGRPTTAASAASSAATATTRGLEVAVAVEVGDDNQQSHPKTASAAAGIDSGNGNGNGGLGKEAFVRDVTAIISRVTQATVEEDKVEVKERLGGKYVSVAVDVMVRAPELVNMVYDELAKDPRVVMKF